jgi:hypothetical protein
MFCCRITSFSFHDDVRSIKIGRVRAALTDDQPAELEARQIPAEIIRGNQFKQTVRDGKIEVTMPACCWIVTVTGASENAREEAKWLVDVAKQLARRPVGVRAHSKRERTTARVCRRQTCRESVHILPGLDLLLGATRARVCIPR